MAREVLSPGGVELVEHSAAPANPAAGRRLLYPKADGFYERTSAGVETKVGPTAGGATATPPSSGLSAAASTTATTYGATGLSVTLAANKSYVLTAWGQYRTAATTTGIGLRLNTAATGGLIATAVRYTVTIWNANTPTKLQGAALAAALLTPGVTAANTDYDWEIRGRIRGGATGGPLLVEYASEVAGSAVTIQPDSYLMAQEVA